MRNQTKWCWLLAPALLMGAAASSAATYSASATTGGTGTAGCTGSRACTDPGWGIDLNDNTGFRWSIPGGAGGPAQLFIKAASFSGERRMSLWLNNTRINTITLNSTNAPRPQGKEFGAYAVTLAAGTNNVELRDTEGTAEFDAIALRVEAASVGRSINNRLEAESNDGMAGVQFEPSADQDGSQSAGWVDAGDYIEWQINVPSAGYYQLTTRSAAISDAALDVWVNGTYISELGIDKTQGWQVWKDFNSSSFYLAAGSQKLRVRFAGAGQNLNWVKLNPTVRTSEDVFSPGAWRMVSRQDRSSLSLNNVGALSGSDYYGLDNQLWYVAPRGGGRYEFKNKTSNCFSSQDNQSLTSTRIASCNTSTSAWGLELMRARSESRPAIYRLRAPNGLCARPNGINAPILGACDLGARWYLEASGWGERTGNREYTLNGLLLIKPTTDVPGLTFAQIPQDIVDGAKVSFVTGVKTWLERITDGRVSFTGATQVSTDPINQLYLEGGNWLPADWTLPNDVQRFVPRGAYDTVQVFYTAGSVPDGWGWGPGRSIASNHTLWTTVSGGDVPASAWTSGHNEPTEVFIHEPMHGLDGHYEALGVPLPEGLLHGADVNRYGWYLNIENNGWVHFYRDYWLGQIIATDDTYRGYGPRMFRLPTVRQWALTQPASSAKIMQSSSGKCWVPQGGVTQPSAGTRLVLTGQCFSAATSFVLEANGMLRHKSSGMCVHPSGGSAVNNAELILQPSCSLNNNAALAITDLGSVRNKQTLRCVHPLGGSDQPAENTPVIFHDGCDEGRLRFHFQQE